MWEFGSNATKKQNKNLIQTAQHSRAHTHTHNFSFSVQCECRVRIARAYKKRCAKNHNKRGNKLSNFWNSVCRVLRPVAVFNRFYRSHMWNIFRAFKPKPKQMRLLMISFTLTKQRKIFALINLDINFKTIYIFLNRTLSTHTQSQAHAKDLSGDPKPINKSFIAKSTRRAKLIKTTVSFSVSIACFFLPLSCSVFSLQRGHSIDLMLKSDGLFMFVVKNLVLNWKFAFKHSTFASLYLSLSMSYIFIDRSIEREMNPLTLTHCLTFHQRKPNLCSILSSIALGLPEIENEYSFTKMSIKSKDALALRNESCAAYCTKEANKEYHS